jgi:hypothetical protein
MKKYPPSLIIIAALALGGCGKEPVTAEAAAVSAVPPAAPPVVQTTTVTDENYALAESQVIFTDYVKRIAAATGTNGVGVFMHNKKGADPKDRTVVRINFDTLYSFAIVDLAEDATLTMPETGGRYQSAWIITEEHYNPMAFTTPGSHLLTQENAGNRYVTIVMRTQANTADPADMAKANALQEQLKLEQSDRGSYVASHQWDMDEILAMRAKYMAIVEKDNITADVMFGKKGEVSLKDHNCGTAYGWGGFTPQMAVYPGYMPTSTAHQTLTLADVPVKAFWSITIYDAEGYPQGEVYNINSQFAVPNDDGSFTINFGGDKGNPNYMDIFDGWNFTLRMYEPTEAYFNGDWVRPELQLVE